MWWGAGVVICLERGADVHTAQQMPLPLTASCFSKIQMVLPFCYRLTRVVPDKGLLNGCTAVYMNVINVQGVSVYLSNDCALYKSTHSLTHWSILSIADTTARCKVFTSTPQKLHLGLLDKCKAPNKTVSLWVRTVFYGSILCDPSQPNPSADWPNPTLLTTSGKIWTQPNTASNNRFPVPVISAVKSNLTARCNQIFPI